MCESVRVAGDGFVIVDEELEELQRRHATGDWSDAEPSTPPEVTEEKKE